MSNINKYEKLLYKRNRLKNHCGHQMNKITELKQELQRKDNIINGIKELVENELPYLYEIDKEYENIEGNTYFTYKEYDYKKILDKIKEVESK